MEAQERRELDRHLTQEPDDVGEASIERLNDALTYTFLFMYHYDKMNAAVHMVRVKFSPLTFALAEHVDARVGDEAWAPADEVLSDRGTYDLDPGR